MDEVGTEANSSSMFFLPVKGDGGFSSLEEALPTCSGCVRSGAEVFLRNLQAVHWTLTIPHVLAVSAARLRNYQELYFKNSLLAQADAIEALKAHEDLEEAHVDPAVVAEKTARGITELAAEILEEARHLLEHMLEADGKLATGAREILRQGAVLLWGAFEVLASDLFKGILNERPSLAMRVLKDADSRKFFQLKSVDLETLQSFQFDLASHMGDVLSQVGRIDSIPCIKSVFAAISPEPTELREILSDRELWVLSQRRNIILHRRAIVDAQYLASTGDPITLGEELKITPADLRTYRKVVQKAGLKLIQDANLALEQQEASAD